MKINKLIHQIELPCPKCPYTLGMLHAIKNPCPECRENGYQTFERFKRLALGKAVDFHNGSEGDDHK